MNKEQKLHKAVKDNDVATLETLLKEGVDVNCLFYGWTPLQYAISLGNMAFTFMDN